MVSGLAPGRDAPTLITGNSTCGNGATGRNRNARIPASSSPTVSREVPTGRLMNGDETLKLNLLLPVAPGSAGSRTVQTVATDGQTRDRRRASCKASIAGSTADHRQW